MKRFVGFTFMLCTLLFTACQEQDVAPSIANGQAAEPELTEIGSVEEEIVSVLEATNWEQQESVTMWMENGELRTAPSSSSRGVNKEELVAAIEFLTAPEGWEGYEGSLVLWTHPEWVLDGDFSDKTYESLKSETILCEGSGPAIRECFEEQLLARKGSVFLSFDEATQTFMVTK